MSIFVDMKKFMAIVTLAVFVVLGVWFYIHFFFVWGTGVKAGELNQVVYKGWVWKTYEGRAIMSGFRNKSGKGLQSNDFEFSVDKKALGRRANGSHYSVADSLMRCSGKTVQVKYKEFRGALPWRGMQKCIVYEILSVQEPNRSNAFPVTSEL